MRPHKESDQFTSTTFCNSLRKFQLPHNGNFGSEKERERGESDPNRSHIPYNFPTMTTLNLELIRMIFSQVSGYRMVRGDRKDFAPHG